ncbi:cystatin-B-like [Mya arenaria]|uniref:cystatin-B-like n=1 Tax=Mya arenaria TaxID=6604 RepID=UPI0022E4EC0B|nr:cystatin-B-like [Mya arenaria]XP_052811057.1 cystatin-B-like [Mya arenaria]
MLAGGAGPVQKANDDVKAVCNELKAEILQKAEKDAVEIFEAVSYRSQLVAGTNLFVKIKVNSNGECIHARIFQPLPCNIEDGGKTAELHSVQKDKQMADEVAYF